MTRLLLASGSPSRLRILRGAGIEPLTAVPDVDEEAIEAAHPDVSVRTLVGLLAQAKAEAVIDRLPALLAPGSPQAPAPHVDTLVVVACDSVLELDGAPVGKPHTAERTREIWQRMAGASPVLWSAHWVGVLTRDGANWTLRDHRAAAGETVVHLESPSAEELADYIATEEPFEVAGALTIDGLGGAFIRGIEGDHHNVIGLSLPLLRRLLTEMGIRWTSLWNRTAD